MSCNNYRSKVVARWSGHEIESVVPFSGNGIYLFVDGRFLTFVEGNDHEIAHNIAKEEILAEGEVRTGSFNGSLLK